MHFLDVRTIVFADTVNFTACTLFVVALWRQNRARFGGLGFLAATYILQTAATLLIALRGVIPDIASITLANTFICAASLSALMGLERFTGRVRPQTGNVLLLAAYSAAFTYYAMVPTSLQTRSLTVAAGLLVIWLQLAWLMLHRVDRQIRHATFGVGIVYLCFCLTNVIRIVRYLAVPIPSPDYMHSGTFEVLVLVIYSVLTTSLTIALMQMVSRRLSAELAEQERISATAFRYSPYGLTLTQLDSGTIFEVNEHFLELLGFAREEVIGRSTVDLQVWSDPEDRQAAVDDLRREGKVRDRECRLRKRSGQEITVTISADVIHIGDKPCILTGVSDISERKRVEDEVRELSLRDALTGLLNRRGFFALIEKKIAEADRSKTKLAVLFLDADGLKKINDRLGHEEGDRALKDLAGVLAATFRESDIVARVGGDEFTVCFSESVETHAEKALERLKANLATFNEQQLRPYQLAVSFGSATYDPVAPHTVDELLSLADRKMYRQKQKKAGPSQGGHEITRCAVAESRRKTG